MAFLVKGIPLILQKIFAPLLGVVLAAWFIVLLVSAISGQRHSCRCVASPRRWSVWAGLAVLAIVCTTLCGKNTNGVQNVGGTGTTGILPVGIGGPLTSTGGTPVVPVEVSPQDVSNGWRVAEETAAESFAQPSANTVTNEPWCLRGAHDDAFRIPANGWSYPYATGVTVLSRGELRTSIRAHDFPRAFAQDISLLPLVNWPLLPEGRGESLFWHAATPSNTLLVTWLNGALGRDATNPVSFQAELFPDGGFTYRYEDRTVRHARVWPFDWDNDGLENSVDPDPLTPGPDAHGTNAEWYNTVCSNVFSSVEGGGTGTTGILPVDGALGERALPWREGVNSNAYYFVDVVTESGPAPIYFTGDRDSRLGNPVVVANAFETNRVPLLIGIDYAITSPVPFAISFPVDYMYLEVSTNDVTNYNVRWPLNFVFTEDIGASNRVYTVTVEPYDSGGVLEWDSTVPMRGGSSGNCVNCSGYSAFFTCSNTCTCGGDSTASGRYLVETAEFPVEGGECRCGFDDPPGEDYWAPHGPNDAPSLTISFSSSAVIFEDAYEDSPGVTKPRRSTRVRLTIDAYAGSQGGALWLTESNLGKLTAVSGGVSLPYSQNLAAGESYHATGVYEGLVASERVGDVGVSGSFTETGTGHHISTSNCITVVRVEFTPDYLIDNYPHRHRVGVRESSKCSWLPSTVAGNCEAGTGGNADLRNGMWYYVAPLTSGVSPYLTAVCQSVRYPFALDIVEPQSVIAKTVEAFDYGVPPNVAGGAGMDLELVILPTNVSFMGIAVQEVPSDYKDQQGTSMHIIIS